MQRNSLFALLVAGLLPAAVSPLASASLAPSRLDLPFTKGAVLQGVSTGLTVIKFFLATTTSARLSIYDTRGRLVAELADGVNTAGEDSFTWDAQNIPSGMYFYRLETPVLGKNRRHELKLAG